MKLSRHIGRLSLTLTAIATIVSATSCTSDVAILYSTDDSTSDSTSDGTSDSNLGYSNDLATNYEIQAEGEANALGLIGKRAGADLECTSSESCFVTSDDALFCLDGTTGDFHDETAGSGNLYTGEYASSDGQVETVDEDENSSTATGTGTGDQSGGTSCTADVALVAEDAASDAASAAYANCAAVNAVGDSSCNRKRAPVDLECTSSESCYIFSSTYLMCLEPLGGDYHDEYDGSGNIFSGIYTASDGEVQTITGTLLPTPPSSTGTTGRATATSSEETGTRTGTAADATGTSKASSSSSSASQSSAAAAEEASGTTRQAGDCSALLAAVVVFIAAVF